MYVVNYTQHFGKLLWNGSNEEPAQQAWNIKAPKAKEPKCAMYQISPRNSADPGADLSDLS